LAKTVFLDIDGTLMDTNYLHIEAWAQAFEEVGARPPRSRIHHEVGKGSDSTRGAPSPGTATTGSRKHSIASRSGWTRWRNEDSGANRRIVQTNPRESYVQIVEECGGVDLLLTQPSSTTVSVLACTYRAQEGTYCCSRRRVTEMIGRRR
jgi:phosphoglycolate phosphatase-like HAD superfamily hydrolase